MYALAMRPLLLVVSVVSACDFPRPPAIVDDAAQNFDSVPEADGTVCYGSFARICFSIVPTQPVMLSENIDVDTDSSPRCDQHHDHTAGFCVVAATSFALMDGKTIRAHGSKPLVLLATSTLELAGTVDVSSHHDGVDAVGAGALSIDACSNKMFPTGNSGGFGGGFYGRGGPGEGVDGVGGSSERDAVIFPMILRGGCPGSNGSTTTAGVLAGAGGSGGGAVALIAAEIRINGKINASGAGGHGGPGVRSGGGGGGSGGMIVLDAPSIAAGSNVVLFANGGGGAEGGAGIGSSGSRPGVGADGGEPTGPASPGRGGGLATDGGDGGDGSSAQDIPGASHSYPAQLDGGGGAGGGGSGFIRAPGVSGPNVAPPSFDPYSVHRE